MARYELPPIGSVDFPSTKDGSWSFELPRSGSTVEVDFNVDGKTMSQPAFERVKDFVSRVDAFDAAARAALRDDFESEDGNSAMFLSHHVEEFSAKECRKYFGAADPGVDDLLRALQLQRIGLYPDGEDYVAVFDYVLPEEASDYLLAVEFDASGSVLGVSMDS